MLEQRNVQSMARVLDARTIVEQAEVELRQAEVEYADEFRAAARIGDRETYEAMFRRSIDDPEGNPLVLVQQ